MSVDINQTCLVMSTWFMAVSQIWFTFTGPRNLIPLFARTRPCRCPSAIGSFTLRSTAWRVTPDFSRVSRFRWFPAMKPRTSFGPLWFSMGPMILSVTWSVAFTNLSIPPAARQSSERGAYTCIDHSPGSSRVTFGEIFLGFVLVPSSSYWFPLMLSRQGMIGHPAKIVGKRVSTYNTNRKQITHMWTRSHKSPSFKCKSTAGRPEGRRKMKSIN